MRNAIKQIAEICDMWMEDNPEPEVTLDRDEGHDRAICERIDYQKNCKGIRCGRDDCPFRVGSDGVCPAYYGDWWWSVIRQARSWLSAHPKEKAQSVGIRIIFDDVIDDMTPRIDELLLSSIRRLYRKRTLSDKLYHERAAALKRCELLGLTK